MSRQMLITIYGEAGAGKTTLATFIAQALKLAGASVEVRDEDDLPVDSFEKRLKTVVSSELSCVIATVQSPARKRA